MGREEGVQLGQMHGWAPGVASQPSAVLHLPRSYQASAFICFAWFCMSVLYFAIQFFLVMNPLGVPITYSVSEMWLLGVL